MTINKFVVSHGRIASQEGISLRALDDGLLGRARDALARLQKGQITVSLPWPDGTEGVVGLGLPPFKMPVERLSEAQRDTLDTWEAGREAMKHKGRAFYVTTAGETEVLSLAREAALVEVNTPWNLSSATPSPVDTTNLAGLYGAIAGNFFGVELHKPAHLRDPRPSPERIQQFWDVAIRIVAAAPAFVCNDRLSGAAAAFADRFAIAVLSDPDASAASTT
jgi:hypothetical protein